MTSRRSFLQAATAGSMLLPALAQAKAGQTHNDDRREHYLPNVPLLTHNGTKVRFYDDLVKGKLVVFNMMYTACSNICPPNTANLITVQQALGPKIGREIFMYSITLQPELDDPAALRDYMKKYGIAEGWTFLTGKREDVDLVRRRLGFFDPDPAVDADLRQHTGMLRVGHEARDRWSMIPALATTRQIINSITNYL